LWASKSSKRAPPFDCTPTHTQPAAETRPFLAPNPNTDQIIS
jgi:hypothetical protein